jgi:tetratricopeptide (TPR) repeat protein
MNGTDRCPLWNGRNLVRWLVLLALIVIGGRPLAVCASEYEEATQFYDQGKFGEAKQSFEKLIDAGAGSANVYYNLGNTDFRLGAAGRAMLDYERALTLSPRHPEAQANLKFLRQQNGAKLRPLSWREKIAVNLPVNVWCIVAAVAGWVFVISLVVILRNPEREQIGLWAFSMLIVVVCAVAGVSLWSIARDQTRAVITAQQTEARLAPAESAGVAEALPAGSEVRVLSERGAWIYCELPGSGRGWIPEGTLERVRPAHS